MREYEIEAELLHEFRRHGADGPAYGSIVAAGANACVLHYAPARRRLRAGELCLIDAGCELDGYASDITRTFPADGRFTPAQRELYDIVRRRRTPPSRRPGPARASATPHDAAVRVLAQGMLDTGLLDRNKVGDVDEVIESAAYRQFYMHGTGHWLGRDVHDVGDYDSADEAPVEQPDGLGGTVVKKPSRMLEPGMVVTIEPGIYVRAGEGVPERFWNIGIRIEDDAVVTADGCELISRGVPVAADEIEALMRDGRRCQRRGRVASAGAGLPVFAACAFASGFALRLVDPIVLPVAGALRASPPTTAAMLNTAYALPYALAQPFLGPIGDRFGKQRCIQVCVAGLALMLAAGAFAPTLRRCCSRPGSSPASSPAA